MMTMMMMNKIN